MYAVFRRQMTKILNFDVTTFGQNFEGYKLDEIYSFQKQTAKSFKIM